MEDEKNSDAKKALAMSRVVHCWDSYDHSRLMHRYNIKLAGGRNMQIPMSSDEVVQRMLKRPEFFQHLAWQSILNERLGRSIVKNVATEGTNVVLHLTGDLYMTVPEDELFEDATLATLVLIGASHADARG